MKQSIASMRCLVVDVVLMGAYDWRELANLLAQTGQSSQEGCRCSRGPARSAFRAAHAATHVEGPFSRLLERQLDYRFADLCALVAGSEPNEIVAHMADGGLEPSEIPAMAWALARDPRPEVGALLNSLCEQVQQASLSAFFSSGSLSQGSPCG